MCIIEKCGLCKRVNELEAKVARQKKFMGKQDKVKHKLINYYHTLAKFAADPKYKYQIFRQDDCLFMLMRYAEAFDEAIGKHEFHLRLFDVEENEKTCVAEVKVHNSDGSLKLLRIDTNDGYKRKGHATFILKYLIQYGKTNGHRCIACKLDETTPIGLPALTNFYEKNGFTVKDGIATYDLTPKL